MREVGSDKSRGRPRLFDEDTVLDRAIHLFSSSGFSAVGINELTRATGMKVGSLYKAYQDKEGLFSKALERYIALREAEIAAMLVQAENGRDRIAGLLRLYVRLSSGMEGKLGCLMVAGIGEISKFSFAGEVLHGQLSRRQQLLAEVIMQGKADGSITTSAEPCVAASFLLTLLYGMRVVGKADALTDDTDAFVNLALRVLD